MPHEHTEHNDQMQNRASLTRFAWLSIGAAVSTILLKTAAYYLTGSVGLLSDAIESLVNLIGAAMALGMLVIAARPADDDHVYGHSKAEYFASATEGLLILGAAAGIIFAAVQHLISPHPLEQVGPGLAVSISASMINYFVARKLLSEGRKRISISLEADGHHLMTDVWTSAGVIFAVGVVALTGWNVLDPLIAIAVALNIIWTGFQLVSRSISGLMDESLPAKEQKTIRDVMDSYRERGVTFHALRTRQAAARRFISVHLLVPGDTSVHDAHHIAEDFENDVRRALVGAVTVFTHIEPMEDELSMDDIYLDR
jgi:cation diffusion facilitator family transporter